MDTRDRYWSDCHVLNIDTIFKFRIIIQWIFQYKVLNKFTKLLYIDMHFPNEIILYILSYCEKYEKRLVYSKNICPCPNISRDCTKKYYTLMINGDYEYKYDKKTIIYKLSDIDWNKDYKIIHCNGNKCHTMGQNILYYGGIYAWITCKYCKLQYCQSCKLNNDVCCECYFKPSQI